MINLRLCFRLSECWQGPALHLEVSNAWFVQFCPGLLHSDHSGCYFRPRLSPKPKHDLSWATCISPGFFANCTAHASKAMDTDQRLLICLLCLCIWNYIFICVFTNCNQNRLIVLKATKCWSFSQQTFWFFNTGKAKVLLKMMALLQSVDFLNVLLLVII